MVTFGRAASQELRERVRAQLVEAERALADDPALRAVDRRRPTCSTCSLDCGRRRARRAGTGGVTEALAGFDARHDRHHPPVLLDGARLASASPATPTPAPGSSRTSTTWWSRWSTTSTCAPSPAPRARRCSPAARRWPSPAPAVGDPQARLEPAGEDRPTTPAGRRVGLRAARSREEIDRRKRRLGILVLRRPARPARRRAARPTTPPARERMRQRWRIVLVDEFQDTDPVQWQVLDRAFSGHATMVLIGDPKQAIYAFRGGDVVDLPRTPPRPPPPSRRSRSTGAATPALLGRVPDDAGAAPSSATRGSSCTTSRRTTTAAGWSGRRTPRRSGCASCAVSTLGRRGTAPLTVRQVRPHVAARPRPRRPRAAGVGRDRSRAARSSRATSR